MWSDGLGARTMVYFVFSIFDDLMSVFRLMLLRFIHFFYLQIFMLDHVYLHVMAFLIFYYAKVACYKEEFRITMS